MLESFNNAFSDPALSELFNFLFTGDTPVGLHLVAFNGVILVFWLIRRLRKAYPWRPHSRLAAQALFVVANALVLTQNDPKSLLDVVDVKSHIFTADTPNFTKANRNR